MNILSFGVNVGVGLLLVPYLVGHLGIAAYGLVPLAMILSEYVGFIAQSFNSVVQRFLAIEINQQNYPAANAVFNTSLFIILIFILGQGVVAAVLIDHIDVVLNIPEGLAGDAVWLVSLTVGGYLFSLLSSVFSVSMYSNNRVDLLRLSDVLRIGTRLLLILSLFAWKAPDLKFVGVANLCGGFVSLAFCVFYWKKLTPFLKVSPRGIDLSRLGPMASMAGWLLVSQVGYLLFLRIDTYVVNRFISAEACGEYAAVLQWNQLFRVGAGVLSGVISPLGLIYYARGEIDKLIEMMRLAVKTMSLVLAIPLALVSAFSGDILALWLGEEFRTLGGLLTLHMVGLALNLGVLPLFAVNAALNRVKIPALVTLFLGLVNVLLAILLIKSTNLGYYGVALAGAAVLTLKNALFTTYYVARILEIKTSEFSAKIGLGLAVFACVYAVCSVQGHYFFVSSGPVTLFFLLVLNGIPAALLLLLFYSNRERSLIIAATPIQFQPWLSGVLLKKSGCEGGK